MVRNRWVRTSTAVYIVDRSGLSSTIPYREAQDSAGFVVGKMTRKEALLYGRVSSIGTACSLLLLLLWALHCFSLIPSNRMSNKRVTLPRVLFMQNAEKDENYVNPVTKLASNLLPPKKTSSLPSSPSSAQKPRRKTSIERFVLDFKKSLQAREWFVTGNVDLQFFDVDNFRFEDPDVKVSGIVEYSNGVRRLFDQDRDPRAQIIDVAIISPTFITVTWRLDAYVKILSGIKIKPYIVYTDFMLNDKGLIVSQLDRFSIPGYDIVLSSLFPFLAGTILSSPAPAIDDYKSK